MNMKSRVLQLLTLVFSLSLIGGAQANGPAANPATDKDPRIQPFTSPDFQQAFKDNKERSKKPSVDAQAFGFWSDSGPGSSVPTAKEYYFSSHLSGGGVPSNATYTSIGYYWDNTNLAGWNSSFKTFLVAYADGSVLTPGWYLIDVSSPNSGSVNLSGYGFEADKGLYYAFYVDTFFPGASLYPTPSVSWDSASSNYQY